MLIFIFHSLSNETCLVPTGAERETMLHGGCETYLASLGNGNSAAFGLQCSSGCSVQKLALPGAPAKPMEKQRFSAPKNLVFRYPKQGFSWFWVPLVGSDFFQSYMCDNWSPFGFWDFVKWKKTTFTSQKRCAALPAKFDFPVGRSKNMSVWSLGDEGPEVLSCFLMLWLYNCKPL